MRHPQFLNQMIMPPQCGDVVSNRAFGSGSLLGSSFSVAPLWAPLSERRGHLWLRCIVIRHGILKLKEVILHNPLRKPMSGHIIRKVRLRVRIRRPVSLFSAFTDNSIKGYF